ncbi:MAG: VOC family protein [Fimbriimonadaceae bacterium]|nr:VOC family protein [Fimbriimonadaceae bacterium]
MADLHTHEFPTLTPSITVSPADEAIAWYERALGASVRFLNRTPDGKKVLNAQLILGDSLLMLNDAFPEYGNPGPEPGTPIFVTLHLQLPDVDTAFARAAEHGAEITMPLQDMFWGDRYGQFRDPYGYLWSMGQRIAHPTEAESYEAAKEWFPASEDASGGG